MPHVASLVPKNVPQVETRHRRIRTALPNPETLPVLEANRRFEPRSYQTELPLVWHRAVGYQVFDVSGNCWIDLTSTIFVANVGHGHPKVAAAIREVCDLPLLHTYSYPHAWRTRLAERIVQRMPPHLDKVLFLSTGSESSEAALKIAMSYGRRIRPTKNVVVGLEGSFHGKTMGSQTLGGKPSGKAWIGDLHPRIRHLPYPYPWVLEREGKTGAEFFHDSLKALEASGVALDDIAAFFAEPYQGWCAVFLPKDYAGAMREWATAHQALVGFDEVQAGFGRTGKLFGYEHLGIEADILWCSKAISSSVPVSAVIANHTLLDVDDTLTSTHGGGPLGMAAALAVLDVLDEERLLEEATRKGEWIRAELEAWAKARPDYIRDIYGAGMVWAILVREPHGPKAGELAVELVDNVCWRAFEKGVLTIQTGCGSLKLGPPLSIPDDALKEALAVLRESLDECIAERG